MHKAKGPTIGETVRMWQEFMTINGLSRMGRAVRVSCLLTAFWSREVYPMLHNIGLPVLLNHNQMKFLKDRKIRLPKSEEL